MTAVWRPDLRFCVSFNADPADPGAVPIWVDIGGPRLRTVSGVTRGRQYELNQTQAAAPTIALLDIDEHLNPANTASPYYPNVAPYRQCLLQAMWPNPAAGNLLNSVALAPVNSALVNATFSATGVPYDPSFETYANGATVPWVTAVGFDPADPTVTTSNPRTGTKSLTYDVASGSSTYNQGMSIPLPCTPGTQYTTSLYVRQSSANVQQVFVTDQNLGVDVFNRATSSGWGTADQGGSWTVSGTAANYSTVVGTAIPWLGAAYHSDASVNSSRISTIGSAILDSDQRVTVSTPVVAVGGEIDVGLVARFADTSNYYMAEAQFNTDGTVGVRIRRRVAGTNTTIVSGTAAFGYEANDNVRFRFKVDGTTVEAKAWLDGTVEPSTWTVSATDANILTAGAVGCRSILAAANTNTLPVAVAFSQYSAVGFAAGSSTSTSGSYVRLSVTYTATQPYHTFLLAVPASNAAGLNGTVNVDDLQHEEAASASTWTSTGTVLYPVLRDYVERWPSEWGTDSQGFEGLANITCVDAFGPMNTTPLLAAYPAAVMATDPAYYWPLWDESGSTAFAEVTGNGPPLVFKVSKYGANVAPDAGQSLDILGDPGGTGVQFTPSDAAVPDNSKPGTILASGPFVGPYSPPIILPLAIGSGWAMSIAFWGSTVNDQISDFDDFIVPLSGINNSNTTTPLSIYSDLGVLYRNISGSTVFTLSTGIGSAVINDGLTHHWVGVAVQDATNITLTLYIDGVQVATNTATNASKGGLLSQQATTLNVGGFNNNALFGEVVNGVMGHVSVWLRDVGADVSDLYLAGTGWSGETSGQRINRYLTGETINASFRTVKNYPGPVNIDFGCLSVMGPDDLTTGTDLLSACQNVTGSENGVFWVGPSGAATFAGREVRYLETSSTFTFGEDSANGEYPYQTNARFDYDPTLIYEAVKVTNASGIVATAIPASPAYARRFFNRGFERSINVLDNNEAVDAANYLLNQHKVPTQRVDQIVLDPTSYPTLWPLVFTIEIGTRVTVKRRAKAANSGVGLTMSADYYIEKVSHGGIDMAASTWTITLQMSPADVSQVWILEDTTYGVLDSTTLLGY